jgi:hypothetical protein
MFAVSPMAGKEFIGQERLGEYFRVFVFDAAPVSSPSPAEGAPNDIFSGMTA